METLEFNKLQLHTAFCCMACDGEIAPREIDLIKKMCKETPYLSSLDYQNEISTFVQAINIKGKSLINECLETIANSNLDEAKELSLLDFVIKTIYADEFIEYNEIKFFKSVRCRLKCSNEKILEKFPDVEYWLEDDISTGFDIDKITKEFLDIADLPIFEVTDVAK